MIPKEALQLFDALVAMRMGGQTANPCFLDMLRTLAEVVNSMKSPEKTIPVRSPTPITELKTGSFPEVSVLKEIKITGVSLRDGGGYLVFGAVEEDAKFYCFWKGMQCPFRKQTTYSVPESTLTKGIHNESVQWTPKKYTELQQGEQNFYSYVSERYPITSQGEEAGKKILEALQNSGPPDISSEVVFPPPGKKEN